MSKLTDTTKRTRMYVLYFLIFVIVVLIGQFLYRYISGGETPLSGTSSPYSYVNESFGEITYPDIPSLAIADGSTPSFTVLGQFADSPTSVNVYTVDKPRETLGSTVKAKDLAESLNFNSSSINQAQTLKWSEGGRELVFYKLTENSIYHNTPLKNSSIAKPEFVDIERIDSLISNLTSTLKFPYATEMTDKEYLLRSGTSYTPIASANNADFIKTGYSQDAEIVSLKTASTQTSPSTVTSDAQSIEGKIYFNDSSANAFSLVVSNENQQTDQDKEAIDYLVEFENRQVQINEEETATYKLKSIEKAWEDVKDGNASLKYLVSQGGNPYAEYQPLQVTRFTVDPELSELGFFAPDEWTGYIYPIYIFKGSAEIASGNTAEFIFFVKAIE